MELKEGYKMSELGLIPSDWKVRSVNDCLDLLTDFEANGSFADIANNVTVYQNPNFAWFVRSTDLEKSDLNDVKYVDKKSYHFLKKTALFGGEVLITKRGEIGKVYFFEKKTKYATLAPNLYLLKLNDSVNPFFIYCLFSSSTGNKLLIEKNASTTLGALYKKDVKSIKFPCPSVQEQTAIANALSDADALINSLEKLIAKKRNIKQGVMQKLLEPKPTWISKTIQQLIDEKIIVDHLDGNHGELYPRSNEFTNQGVPYIGANDFQNGIVNFSHCKFLPEFRADQFKKGIAQNGDVLFAHNATVGPVAFLQTNLEKVILSTTATYFRCDNKRLINKFLFYAMQHDFFIKQYRGVMFQSTRFQVPITQQRKFKLILPSPEEQINISNSLFTIATEINLLERKLEKYKLIKQGMMQNLLTGKIRLIKKEELHTLNL